MLVLALILAIWAFETDGKWRIPLALMSFVSLCVQIGLWTA